MHHSCNYVTRDRIIVQLGQNKQTDSILRFSDSAGHIIAELRKKCKECNQEGTCWRPRQHARAHALYACCNVTYIFILHVSD